MGSHQVKCIPNAVGAIDYTQVQVAGITDIEPDHANRRR